MVEKRLDMSKCLRQSCCLVVSVMYSVTGDVFHGSKVSRLRYIGKELWDKFEA